MIATAREHGDLKENAEYHAARDKQSFIEGRVKDLENKLALAEVIDPIEARGRPRRVRRHGEAVEHPDRGGGRPTASSAPTRPTSSTGTISITSPLARSLLGKEVGDEVKVRMPGGERLYEVLEVVFG